MQEILAEQGLKADCWRLVASFRQAVRRRPGYMQKIDNLQYKVLTKEAGEVLRVFLEAHQATGISRQEFGSSLQEAVRNVASDGGALPEVTGVDGETVLRCKAGDVDSLKAALERGLDDPELRARIGAAGRIRTARRVIEGGIDDRVEQPCARLEVVLNGAHTDARGRGHVAEARRLPLIGKELQRGVEEPAPGLLCVHSARAAHWRTLVRRLGGRHLNHTGD